MNSALNTLYALRLILMLNGANAEQVQTVEANIAELGGIVK